MCGSTLFVGTESGNVHLVDTRTMAEKEQINNEAIIEKYALFINIENDVFFMV